MNEQSFIQAAVAEARALQREEDARMLDEEAAMWSDEIGRTSNSNLADQFSAKCEVLEVMARRIRGGKDD